MASRHPEVECAKVWDHSNRPLLQSLGVRSFPTFRLYISGQQVDEHRGASIPPLEAKVNQWKHQAKPSGPVAIKLQFAKERQRKEGAGTVLVNEEMDLDVSLEDGIEVLRFQVLSLTGLEPHEQSLSSSDGSGLVSDSDLGAALKLKGGGPYGQHPLLRLTKKAGGSGASLPPPPPIQSVAPEAWKACCTRVFFGDEAVLQPAGVLRLPRPAKGKETVFVLCLGCSQMCCQPGSVSSAPGVSGAVPFSCQISSASAAGHAMDLFEARVRNSLEVLQHGHARSAMLDNIKAAGLAAQAAGSSSNRVQDTVQRCLKAALMYEQPELQEKARRVMPMEMVKTAGGDEESTTRLLLKWFKKDFFEWCDAPSCGSCGAKPGRMKAVGSSQPSLEEASKLASHVELFKCQDCSSVTRFPRYNHPGVLLDTRRGRCGEFANAFTLCCRAAGLEARHVVDFTDHVWTEVWVPKLGRFVHCDPCENRFDAPLLYERGWGKRLSYVLAFSREGCVDVSRRYTKRWLEMSTRRNLIPEAQLQLLLKSTITSGHERVAAEARELERLGKGELPRATKEEELGGRQTGSSAWLQARGEDGSGWDCTLEASLNLGTRAPCYGSQFIGTRLAFGSHRVLTLDASSSTAAGSCIKAGDMVLASARETAEVVAIALPSGTLAAATSIPSHTPSLCAQLASFLTDLPQNCLVLAACHGKASSDAAATLGAHISVEPVDNDVKAEGFAIAGWKGHKPQDWVRSAEARLVLELRLPTDGETHSARAEEKSCVGAHMLGQLSIVCSDDTQCVKIEMLKEAELEAAGINAIKNLRGGASGFSCSPGKPLLLLGPGGGVLAAEGWKTYWVGPGPRTGVDEVAMQAAVKGLFGELVAQGLEPNAAAAEAIKKAAAQERERSLEAEWHGLKYTAAIGSMHDDTKAFDDGEACAPGLWLGGGGSTYCESGALPIAKVVEVIGWGGDYVNGLQVVYEVAGVRVRGRKNFGDHGMWRQASLVLNDSENIVEVTIKAGRLVTGVSLKTNSGREIQWGKCSGPEGGDTTTTVAFEGATLFCGFHGGFGGHLHHLGAVTLEARSRTEGLLSAPDSIVRLLYGGSALSRALAFMQHSNGDVGETALGKAIEAALKYAGNIVANPSSEKCSRVRCGNAYFERSIGQLIGGGGLMAALGFRLLVEGGEMFWIFSRFKLAHLKHVKEELASHHQSLPANTAEA
ncbi:unnamed protein product [Chrysoparadoxa australica]